MLKLDCNFYSQCKAQRLSSEKIGLLYLFLSCVAVVKAAQNFVMLCEYYFNSPY